MLKIALILTTIVFVNSQSCSLSCRQNGNFENPNDKHSYIQCTNGRAALISCPLSGDRYNRLIFDGKNCRETYVCPKPEGMFPHPNKDLYWRCVNGVSSIEHCPNGQVFSGHYRCIPKFECPELGGHFAHPGNKSEYYKCCFGESKLYYCPKGYIFEQGSDCVPIFLCPQKEGKYRNLRKENQYYQCIDGEPHLRTCPPKQFFDGLECVEKFECPLPDGKFINRLDQTNRTYYVCNNNSPIRMTCPGTYVFYGQECEQLFRCPKPEGRFANPRNQYKYYMCEQNIPYPHQCAEGLEFNEDKQDCQKPFQCPRAFGRFKHPDNNTKFYECDNFVAQVMYCPLGRVFDGTNCVKERDGGRDGFRCPGVGSYRHPTNPSKYYYCGTDLIPKLQECAMGYTYNEVTLTCVRSQFECPQSEGRFAHPHSDRLYFECRSGSAQLIPCPGEQRFDKHSRVCTGNEPKYSCPQPDGLFNHPSNRRLFYHCLGGVPHLRHCGLDKIFDQSIQNCISDNRNYRCPEPNGRFPYPYDDKRYYQCQNNIPHLIDCTMNERYTPSLQSCNPIRNQGDYRCPHPEGLFSHPSNRSLFYYCQGGTPQLRHCGANKIFDSRIQSCINTDYEVYRCPQPDGRFPHPLNKGQYYMCQGNVWQLVWCPNGQHFDRQRARCVAPSSAGYYQCPAPDGLFRHPTNQSRFYNCKNYHAELRECLFHQIFDQESGHCIPWSWPNTFYCPLPNGLFINPQNNSQYYECCQGRPTLKSCAENQIFNGRHCMSEVIYSCKNSTSKHPSYPIHCYNGHRYQYSCPYIYGTELVYNGYRCAEPYQCPIGKGNYVVNNPVHSHQYIRCANGVPSLYTCSRGFAYSDRRGCCMFDEHQTSGYFGYRLDDNIESKPIDERNRGSDRRVPGVVVVEPVQGGQHNRYRPPERPDRPTSAPKRVIIENIPTLPANEPTEVRNEEQPIITEPKTEAPTHKNGGFNDDNNDDKGEEEEDDDDLDNDDYKEEDYNDEEEEAV